jgi:hypothetical protein
MESIISQLDAELQSLAERLMQADAERQVLQAQYNETLALLQQAVRSYDQSSMQ